MKTTLLDQAMAPDALNQAWRRLKSEHTPWSPIVSRDELQYHLMRHLLECRQQVLDGDYRPLPLRQFPVPKPDGRTRVITAQYLQDKLVQRAILTVLEPRAERLFHDDSYAYRPNRNVEQALNKARERIRIGQDWLVDADIEKFFDSIPHRPLIKALDGFVNDSRAMKLIMRWLDQGAHVKSLLSTTRGISQGAILSPLFCNLYLHGFDSALARAKVPFVRFADDFLLFAPAQAQADQAKDYAARQLEHLGLTMHPEKTRVVRSSPAVIFLGEALPNPAGEAAPIPIRPLPRASAKPPLRPGRGKPGQRR
ncbi:reverse transcriptase domain-containing protein [uncultured Thiodictyon sp.]|uniref:reverse transcriptase domain-containing protein n=1 Tax=uncultured Thiodictyon sp. TaxID=1846217 RepID=UPI0025F18149|nr:reverse transcriptase domain-containing protein [uncultured Thiodictyon sp.]